jgi:hypothetical protein
VHGVWTSEERSERSPELDVASGSSSALRPHLAVDTRGIADLLIYMKTETDRRFGGKVSHSGLRITYRKLPTLSDSE